MPISFFIGPPRTGKTYEAVWQKVLPAIKQGRRVVTNIPLNPPAIIEYWDKKKSPGIELDIAYARDIDLSEPYRGDANIIVVDRRHLVTDDTYPWDPDGDYIPGNLVRPGDMLVIDEAHVVFPSDQKLSDRIQSFFRVHGHFYDDALGCSIDIVIITQDESTLRREFKYLGEVYMKVYPLRSGKNGRYKASYYPSVSCSVSEMIGRPQIRKITSDVYSCYKSFTHGSGGTIKKSDNRSSNITLGLKIYLAFGAFITIFGAYQGYRYFNGNSASQSKIASSSVGSGGRSSGNRGVRCYSSGIFFDGAWHSLNSKGQLTREAGGPGDGCAASRQGSSFPLGWDG